jgi:hypothetical protein
VLTGTSAHQRADQSLATFVTPDLLSIGAR